MDEVRVTEEEIRIGGSKAAWLDAQPPTKFLPTAILSFVQD
jgi:hypothetical protein